MRTSTYDRAVIGLGILLVAAGLILNPWVLAHAARDGRIDSAFLRAALWIADLGLIAAGIALVRFRPRVSVRDALLSVVALLLPLLLLEVGLRGEWWKPPSRMQPSERLGWVPRAFDSAQLEDAPFGTRAYSTGAYGFRRYGDSAAEGTVVLFIGDSFTHATEVGDGQAYYDVIARAHPGLEVFAFGARGYGSLQEYLVLDAVIESIRPDLVVWQFASNDLVTNDLELEVRHWAFNNQAPRPYLRGDSIVVRFPSDHALFRHSHLARFVAVRIARLRGGRSGHGAIAATLAGEPQTRARAVDTTRRIMARVRARAGDVPVVAFQVDRPDWLGTTYAGIAQDVGIPFIPGIPDAVARAKAEGQVVDFSPRDGHWNQAGHAIAGREILSALVDIGLLPPP